MVSDIRYSFLLPRCFQPAKAGFRFLEINNAFLKKGLPHHGCRSLTFVQDDALPSAVILNRGKNGTYKDKTCYVLSPKTAHSKKCFRPSPCGGKGKRFFDGISIFPALKKRMSFFQTYASEVSCYITLRETSSPERFAQAPAFISFTMPFIRLYSPSMRRRSSIFLVRRSLE